MKTPLLCSLLLIGWTFAIAAEEPKPQAPTPAPASADSSPPAETPWTSPDHSVQSMMLLGSDPVMLDLKLSDDQRARIQDLVQTVRLDIQKVFGATPAERQDRREQIRAQLRVIVQKYQQKVAAILTPAQSQRLAELTIQSRGYLAITDAQVAAELKLTDKQKQQIEQLFQEDRDQRAEMRNSTRGTGKAGRLKRRAWRKELNVKLDEGLKAVLTPEQLKQFETLKGQKTEVPLPDVQLGEEAS